MSETAEYLLIATVIAFALSALWWWLVDVLYTERTGKPASERNREKEKRAKQLTARGFRFEMGFNALMVMLWPVLLWFERGRTSDRFVLPIVMTVVSAARLLDINSRWKRQNSSVSQSSEAET